MRNEWFHGAGCGELPLPMQTQLHWQRTPSSRLLKVEGAPGPTNQCALLSTHRIFYGCRAARNLGNKWAYLSPQLGGPPEPSAF